jgi:hypothetical protein
VVVPGDYDIGIAIDSTLQNSVIVRIGRDNREGSNGFLRGEQ